MKLNASCGYCVRALADTHTKLLLEWVGLCTYNLLTPYTTYSVNGVYLFKHQSQWSDIMEDGFLQYTQTVRCVNNRIPYPPHKEWPPEDYVHTLVRCMRN